MKTQNNTYNALNMRGLKELPPPIICNHTGVATLGDVITYSAQAPLLHQASASCGRVFLCHTDLTDRTDN